MENQDDCSPIPTDSSRITATPLPRFPVSTAANDHRNLRDTVHGQFHHERFEEFSGGENASKKGLMDGEEGGDELHGEERGVHRQIQLMDE